MKKILPMSQECIAHAPVDSYILSIIQNFKEAKEWELYHFLHIALENETRTDYFYPRMLWNYCPFITKFDIPYIYVLNKNKCFIDFVKWAIENDFYIYLLLNMKYIKEYRVQEDCNHNPMIFGIDEEKKIVYIQDFFEGIYKSITVCYNDIEEAFVKVSHDEDYNTCPYCGDLGPVTLVQFNVEGKFEFDFQGFQEELREYINGKNFYLRDGITWKKGKGGLNSIFGYMVYEWATNNLPTTRIMSLFYKHGTYWKKRIDYLMENNIVLYNEQIVEMGNQLLKKSRINLNYYLKLCYTGKIEEIQNQYNLKQRILECSIIVKKIGEYFLKDDI